MGAKDLNNSSTARSDQRKDSQWPRGILSTWEPPTHLQYTIPDANRQLHLLLPTHEMWELPTPLIVANKPSREMRDTGVNRSASEVYENYPLVLKHSILTQTITALSTHSQAYNPCSILSCKQAHIRTSNLCATITTNWVRATQIHHLLSQHKQLLKDRSIEKQQLGATNSTSAILLHLTQQRAINNTRQGLKTYPNKLGAKSDAYANRLHKGDVFAHLTSFNKTSESNISTKRLSKRSPTLPLLLQSELSTIGNRRR
ncbi:hypothetical protein F511_22058 [Dorcoceras hygrometricum]|uniref:Uncharacterized protein n=1 Tax=Dorcoceras hygrometricum TaxID=472368 RepID=A0A2Z7C3M6_9LAMI|nr:hypothetical protein F511_22058 [Dorcoceras hygrometricum]